MARRYLVVRTDKNARSFILSEVEAGRLRQGWGWRAEQDLREIRKRVSAGVQLTGEESAAWRNRRLLGTEPDGMKPGDIVVIPNLPQQGQWVLVRVQGQYRFGVVIPPGGTRADYGHVIDVTPVRSPDGNLAVVEADSELVDARLRASMRNMSRMWSVDSLGGPIDRLIAAVESGADASTPEPQAQKLAGFWSATTAAVWENIRQRYKGAEFEHLVQSLLQNVYVDGRVEHWGGAGEKGADLIVFTRDVLDIEYKIAVQVKLYDGEINDPHALDQIREAHKAHRVDAGIVVTTATSAGDAFQARREQIEAELGIDVRLIMRDELTELLMKHSGRTQLGRD